MDTLTMIGPDYRTLEQHKVVAEHYRSRKPVVETGKVSVSTESGETVKADAAATTARKQLAGYLSGDGTVTAIGHLA
jgi:hypothetical protein